uniref:Peptidoglycan recognition protein LC, isoform K n=1 Tax=Drosophila melanogaster TaxID=7227 RepID=A0A2U8U141_DROME|nr:peptidoglycan recognition protein LC, isoform K [Drosophila melanogaster]AWM95309.1 peptidoglycan recognition protein LC, isoform K [Drosophila melanogaster]|eukprot:NP_001350860.1 peptidoglycan recognition protein LC, isoform K [Drosophila melanogaster]
MSRNTLEICLKCHGIIVDNDRRIECDNVYCGRSCHRKCTELSEDQLKLLEMVPNLRWKCDNCLNGVQIGAQMSKWLEKSLREHEKRLEILEQGLVKRSKHEDPAQTPPICPFLPNTVGRKAVTVTVVFVTLTFLLGIVLATTTNLFGKTLNQNLDNIGGGLILRFVERQQWLAQPPQKEIPDLELPVGLVIALPTNSENCSTQAICVLRVRLLQTYDIESSQKCDIAYNFLIGGDGNVYVGRGWNKMGAHMNNINYDSQSLSFAYIGSFKTIQPSAKQLSVTRLLLERGVKLGKIAPSYRFTASSKLMPSVTDFKADALYASFANWTHWS